MKIYDDEYDLKLREYFNGKKLGKGKEYFCNYLKFEGEYLRGEKIGKGKKYYWNGQLKFGREYLFGKKCNGKGYDEDRNKLYGLKNGRGIVKKYSKYHDLLYEYEFIYGNKNGKGREFLNKKLVFEEEYINGSIIGKVKSYSLNSNKII